MTRLGFKFRRGVKKKKKKIYCSRTGYKSKNKGLTTFISSSSSSSFITFFFLPYDWYVLLEGQAQVF